MNKNFIMFSGKQLGAECIKVCLEKRILPRLVVINPEDKGKDTSSDASVLKICEENNIRTIPFKELSNLSNIKSEFSGVDVAFSTFCSRIISPEIIALFPKGITNLHFSLLPKYRGQFPTVYSIFNGDTETGVTLHWINEGTDSGDIILQRKIDISPSMTGFELFERCKEVGVEIFKDQLNYLISNEWPISTPQEGVENHPIQEKKLPNNGEINWSWSGEKIYNFLRACYHPRFPLPGFNIGNLRFEIKEKGSE